MGQKSPEAFPAHTSYGSVKHSKRPSWLLEEGEQSPLHPIPSWSLIIRDRAPAPRRRRTWGLTHLGKGQVAPPLRLDAQSCSATYCPPGKRLPVPGAWL